MTNLPSDNNSVHHYFKPVYQADNRLIGMEMIAYPVTKHATGYSSAADLDIKRQITVWSEQILFLEKFKTLLASQQITIWLSIDSFIVTEIMQNTHWINRLQGLPFLALMIDENFPGLVYGRNNLRLIWLAEKFPLALANLGSGKSANRAVFDRLFQHVFLSQEFIYLQINRPSFIPFTNAIIRQIAPCCDAFIVCGVDDISLYHKIKDLGFSAMQGNLWPDMRAENISTLFNISE